MVEKIILYMNVEKINKVPNNKLSTKKNRLNKKRKLDLK